MEKRDNAKDNHSAYVYDNMQRLCEVSYPEAGKETYIYDAVGNRLEKKVQNSSENPTQGYTEQYRYDERNRLVQKQLWENGSATPADTTTYTYDAQGSLLSEQSSDLCRKYLYNDFHQCIRTEVIRGREEEAERILQENRYDGEGLRFSLIENGKRTDFITNGWDNLAELDENGQVTKRIIRGMGIVASEGAEENADATEATGNIIDATSAFAGTSAYHYYHGNERMDVEFITDEAGQVVNGYTYGAFGTIITSSEKLQNHYTYNGEAFDKTTEQYYLRKRFYNPKLSRFIQEDEYRGDGLNLYAFCANNPVMYVDPSGYKGEPVPFMMGDFYHPDINAIDYNKLLRGYVGEPPAGMYDPHAHHVLYKRGNGKKQQALVREAQEILVKVDIDPITSEYVLCWAPNRVKGQHSYKTLKKTVDDIKRAYYNGEGKAGVIEALNRSKEEAANRKKTSKKCGGGK